MKPTYYVKASSLPGHFDLRQERFRAELEAGKEHKHDLMATGFTAQGMRELISKHFPDATIDTAALPPL